jgi:hypothetical protein
VRFITDFADQAALLPTAALLPVLFAAQGWWRATRAWITSIGAALAFILATKFIFIGCNGFSISGHTGAASAIWGAAACTALARWMHPIAAAAVPGLVAALLIGGTRVALHTHSLAETSAGGAIGLCAAVAFAALAGKPPQGFSAAVPLLATLAVATLAHGYHLDIEAWLRAIAGQAGSRFCGNP